MEEKWSSAGDHFVRLVIVDHCMYSMEALRNPHYVALPECFGDAFCEGRKLPRQLLGRVSLCEKDWGVGGYVRVV